MKARDFINTMERIRSKDKKYDVYPDLLDLPVERVVKIIQNVEAAKIDEEIDAIIAETKQLLTELTTNK